MWHQDYVKVYQRELARQAEQHALAQATQPPKRPPLLQRLAAWLRPEFHRRERMQAEPKFGRKKTIVGHCGTLYADEIR